MHSFPFRLIGESGTGLFQSSLNDVLRLWATTWFSQSPKFACTIQAIDSTPAWHTNKWVVFGSAPESWVAWPLDGTISREIVSKMFGTSAGISAQPSTITQALIIDCIEDFYNKVMAACGSSATPTPELLNVYDSLRTGLGSGVICLKLGEDFPQQQVFFGGDIVEKIIKENQSSMQPESEVLLNRHDMLGEYKTTLEITVGKAEIALHDLVNIEIGDVIRLDKLVNDHFDVQALDGKQVLGKAHLGIIDNHKAIQFIA